MYLMTGSAADSPIIHLSDEEVEVLVEEIDLDRTRYAERVTFAQTIDEMAEAALDALQLANLWREVANNQATMNEFTVEWLKFGIGEYTNEVVRMERSRDAYVAGDAGHGWANQTHEENLAAHASGIAHYRRILRTLEAIHLRYADQASPVAA